MSLITAEDILSAYDTDFVEVEVPEWTPKEMKDKGETKKLRLQVMSAKEAIDFTRISGKEQRDIAAGKDGAEDTSLLRIIQLCAVDDNGKKLFTVQQLDEIKSRSFKVLVRLQDEALKVNGFTKRSAEKLEDGVKKD